LDISEGAHSLSSDTDLDISSDDGGNASVADDAEISDFDISPCTSPGPNSHTTGRGVPGPFHSRSFLQVPDSIIEDNFIETGSAAVSNERYTAASFQHVTDSAIDHEGGNFNDGDDEFDVNSDDEGRDVD